MTDPDVCPACRSSRVEAGTLASAALWLDRQSALSKAFGGVQVQVRACLDCGHLALHAPPADLQKLVGG